MAQGCVYLQALSRGNNVEGAIWREHTILVHITCIHKSWWEMLHDFHRFSPSLGVLPIHNISLDWTVHHKSSVYMDRDGWLKDMNQLTITYGSSPVNSQILFSDVHDSHFDGSDLPQTQWKNIQPFILRAGDSINYQPNDNGTKKTKGYLQQSER